MAEEGAGAAGSTSGAGEPSEALHDQAIAAVEAWQSEADETKRGPLKEAATKSVAAAKEYAAAQKALALANKPPEKYELALPKDSRLKPEHLEEVATFAKANKLTQAQALLVLERENGTVAKMFGEQEALVNAERAQWAKELLAKPEIANDESKLKVYAENAKRVVDRFGSKQFTEQLTTSGLGNHPGFLDLMNAVFKTMKEDDLVIPGSTTTEEKKSAAQELFGKSLKDIADGKSTPKP